MKTSHQLFMPCVLAFAFGDASATESDQLICRETICAKEFEIGSTERACVKAHVTVDGSGGLTSRSLGDFAFLFGSRMNGESCSDARYFSSRSEYPAVELQVAGWTAIGPANV